MYELNINEETIMNEWNKVFPKEYNYNKVKEDISSFQEGNYVIWYIPNLGNELVYDIEEKNFFGDFCQIDEGLEI